MTADIFKQGGYAITGGDAHAPSVTSYAIVGTEGQLPAVNSYAIIAPPAQVLNNGTYAMVGTQSTVPNLNTYAIIHPFYPPHLDLRLDYPFIEARFPECVSFGSSGGPGFKTSVFELDSGYTGSAVEWERLRAKYNVTFENAVPADIAQVEEFFYGVRGQAIGFRYKDWSDYQISKQNVLVGDGTTTKFQIFKRYSSGGFVFDRMLKKIVNGTLSLNMDGTSLVYETDFFVNHSYGQLVFIDPPAAGAVGEIDYCEFDVPVRFDIDTLDVSYDEHRMLSIGTLPLIEILV